MSGISDYFDTTTMRDLEATEIVWPERKEMPYGGLQEVGRCRRGLADER